jgi:hypothetical protein
MEPEGKEFIRRFALHILPSGFVRIRHYGMLSSTSKKRTVSSIREQLAAVEIRFTDRWKTKPVDPKMCPCRGTPTMVTVEILPARGPPQRAAGKDPVVTKI